MYNQQEQIEQEKVERENQERNQQLQNQEKQNMQNKPKMAPMRNNMPMDHHAPHPHKNHQQENTAANPNATEEQIRREIMQATEAKLMNRGVYDNIDKMKKAITPSNSAFLKSQEDAHKAIAESIKDNENADFVKNGIAKKVQRGLDSLDVANDIYIKNNASGQKLSFDDVSATKDIKIGKKLSMTERGKEPELFKGSLKKDINLSDDVIPLKKNISASEFWMDTSSNKEILEKLTNIDGKNMNDSEFNSSEFWMDTSSNKEILEKLTNIDGVYLNEPNPYGDKKSSTYVNKSATLGDANNRILKIMEVNQSDLPFEEKKNQLNFINEEYISKQKDIFSSNGFTKENIAELQRVGMVGIDADMFRNHFDMTPSSPNNMFGEINNKCKKFIVNSSNKNEDMARVLKSSRDDIIDIVGNELGLKDEDAIKQNMYISEQRDMDNISTVCIAYEGFDADDDKVHNAFKKAISSVFEDKGMSAKVGSKTYDVTNEEYGFISTEYAAPSAEQQIVVPPKSIDKDFDEDTVGVVGAVLESRKQDDGPIF